MNTKGMILHGLHGAEYEIAVDANQFVEETHGWIWNIENQPGLQAKVYHPDAIMGGRDKEKEEKLKAMMNLWVPEYTSERVIMPQDLVYDEEGRFRGYVREKAAGYDTFHQVIQHQKTMDVRDKIHIGKELIEAIKAVHRMNAVCGNLHRNHILVSPGYQHVKITGAEYFRFRDPVSGTYFAEGSDPRRNPDTGLRYPHIPDDLALANHLKKLFETQIYQAKLPGWERAFTLTFLNGMNNPLHRTDLDQYYELLDDYEERIKEEEKEE